MALEVASLYATLGLDKSGFENGLTGARGKLGGFAGTVGTALGGATVSAAGIATAAIAGVGIAGVAAFSDFEAGMNEVFTLMPGASKDAMSQMEGDVLDFSRRFGVLPEETIPALYQALSAGVPVDNVFAFLEQGQMAAKGGVTELTTAVDGITSVVNAYGSDVMDAATASDLMFTAVRLGKTNFEELSASLFNVLPTASSLGIEFGTVTAGLAAMTAAGVPTSVATTQLRQMLVELGKDGSKAALAFEDAAGVSFPEFIAAGGTVQEALALMSASADENNTSISNMFGSVEAGNAALTLAGTGAEAFDTALGEMENSAGATQTAFEQMDQGGAVAMEKLRATASTTMIQIGDSLQGATAPILETMLPHLETFGAWFTETGAPAIEEFATNAGQWISDFIENAKPILDDFAITFSDTIEPAMMMVNDAIERIAASLGIASEDVSGMDAVLWILKATLDSAVIGIEAIGLAFQGIAWVFETVRDAVDMWKSLNDQITTMLDLIENGDFGVLSDIAGWMGDTRGTLGFDTGGVVPGPTGSPQLAVVHGGETILPTHKTGGAGASYNITINANDSAGGQRAGAAFVNELRSRGLVMA